MHYWRGKGGKGEGVEGKRGAEEIIDLRKAEIRGIFIPRVGRRKGLKRMHNEVLPLPPSSCGILPSFFPSSPFFLPSLFSCVSFTLTILLLLLFPL